MFLWEGEPLWIIGNYKMDTFPSRVERESRCGIGIVDFKPLTGLVQHVGFRGYGMRVEDYRGVRMIEHGGAIAGFTFCCPER